MSDVLVLYTVSNDLPLSKSPASTSYNAFYIPRKNGGVTLSTVKQSCLALRRLSPLGSDGYHWRVRIDEKPNTSHSSGGSSSHAYSWWDVQDENARLPVKEATPSELKRMFGPSKEVHEGDMVTQEVTKAAKGAMKYMGKAMNAVASSAGAAAGGGMDEDDYGAMRTPVICFKLLDLGKVNVVDGNGGGGGVRSARKAATRPRTVSNNGSASSARRIQQQHAAAPISAGAPRIQQQQQQQQRRPAAAPKATPTANLMDFGAPSPAATTDRASSLHHASSMPVMPSQRNAPPSNETRAEKLKREYAQKAATSNRVWDDVDQRWVEGPVKNGEASSKSTTSNNNTSSSVQDTTKSLKGISLDASNAIGKSQNVASAIHARVAEMEQSQQKAVAELRAREEQKAKADAEEDVIRQRLDGKLKVWSEEHGKKKQLRALLANLHTILWEGSGWKQVSLADVLDDSKVKRVYHKASRVVHPDKAGHLDAEKRFVAKRVFDALTQAKVEFDEGAK
ncbi:predicted protein [Thalassiosira pseudonana CCMP1335]|uniref:J domain-containing protein n=1 Tax=Thalassiosira pseudonana TaxID=35128 RepID=B8LDL1_THAPS|nr:predicted protein [Thalassiosira pseudonana CCMP1335]EED86568.1 predicted protein [Thalassiosira pseudonana CCMP1335]|eukprot:g13646.t1 g13646   contig9:120733-122256(+)